MPKARTYCLGLISDHFLSLISKPVIIMTDKLPKWMLNLAPIQAVSYPYVWGETQIGQLVGQIGERRSLRQYETLYISEERLQNK